MNARVKNVPRWRKPNLCICGARMELTKIYDAWVLRCHNCGFSHGSVGSLNARPAS